MYEEGDNKMVTVVNNLIGGGKMLIFKYLDSLVLWPFLCFT